MSTDRARSGGHSPLHELAAPQVLHPQFSGWDLSCREGLSVADKILALNQAAGIVERRYVAKPQITRQGAEEGNSVSNEHRHPRDNETLNEACAQEPLNRDPSVDVEVVGTASSEFRDDLSRRSGHLFHNTSAHRGYVDGPAAENHYALLTIGPNRKGQNRFEGLAADHKRIHACHELVVAVRFAAARWQKVEIAIRSRYEAVEAGADKDRNRHRRLLTCDCLTLAYADSNKAAPSQHKTKSLPAGRVSKPTMIVSGVNLERHSGHALGFGYSVPVKASTDDFTTSYIRKSFECP
jgi:hypothetical protein